MKTLSYGLMAVALAVAAAGTAQASDDYCREYQRRVTIGGKVQDSYGTACLQPDGSWKIAGEGDAEVVGTTEPVFEASQPVFVQNEPVVVYEEPLYVQREVRYVSAPVWWGMNLSFNDHDGWGGGRGHGHGGHHGGGHGRHH